MASVSFRFVNDRDLLTVRLSSYYAAARYSAKLGDVKKALSYAEKALDVERTCIGTDHDDFRKQLDIVLQLRYAARKPRFFVESKIEWYESG